MQDTLSAPLQQVLDTTPLKPEVLAWGQRLVSRLASDIQVVVVGPPDCGKTSVINMLSGEPDLPKGCDVPVIELAAGATRRVVIESGEGEITTRPGHLSDQPVPPDTVRVRQETARADLRGVGFTKVTLAGSPARQAALLNWAVGRADIVLWCTQTFGPPERELWRDVPDAVKDHSFLVLTMADQLLMKGILSERIADLEAGMEDGFLNLFPLATIQAIAARASGADGQAGQVGQVGQVGLWKSSGGQAVQHAIDRQIASGRMADQDSAHLFLNRYAPGRAPNRVAPEPEPEAAQAATTEPEDARPKQVFGDALRVLQTHADRMLAQMGQDQMPDAATVLDQCSAAAAALSDVLGETAQDAAQTLRADASEASDMMMLFRLEQTEDAAADAVTLLLQLKREVAEQAVG